MLQWGIQKLIRFAREFRTEIKSVHREIGMVWKLLIVLMLTIIVGILGSLILIIFKLFGAV